MRRFFTNLVMLGFLILFLPCTVTLLMNGRAGIHTEEELPQSEYRVLSRLMEEADAAMEEETLRLLAILYRTEDARTGRQEETEGLPEAETESYGRMYRAVVSTQGMVVTIGGAYRELPYHAVSAGRTRDGTLLGEDFAWVRATECPHDVESEAYFQSCTLSEEELQDVLGTDFSIEEAKLQRDQTDYVTLVTCGEKEWQGETFRSLLHLSSSCFTWEADGCGVRVTVRGSGHGFGISLYTADCMAREGASAEEILPYFYENAECITIR